MLTVNHEPQSEATILMETSTHTTIMTLKKDLLKVIESNNYNLLSPEVINLSNELDRLMLPLFERQLNHNFPI